MTSLIVVAIIMNINSSFAEIMLARFLLKAKSLDTLYYLTTNDIINNIFIVRLVTAFSDGSIYLLKVYQVLELKDVIAPLILILLFDINKNYFQSPHLKLAIKLFFMFFILKYLSLIIVASLTLIRKLSYILAVNIFGFVLLVIGILFLIDACYLFYGFAKVLKDR